MSFYSIKRRRDKQVTRKVKPFSNLSVVEEFEPNETSTLSLFLSLSLFLLENLNF